MTATKAPAGGARVAMLLTPIAVDPAVVVVVHGPSSFIEQLLQIGAARTW